MKEYTVLVDDREKRPLPLPKNLELWDSTKPPHLRKQRIVRIHTRSARLETGDYLLAGYEDRCIIERKAHLDELDQNLVPAKKRQLFIEELTRLQVCSYPVLLLEGDPYELERTNKNTPCVPNVTRDQLLFLLARYGISLYTMSTSTPNRRRKAGEWLVATLIAATRSDP